MTVFITFTVVQCDRIVPYDTILSTYIPGNKLVIDAVHVTGCGYNGCHILMTEVNALSYLKQITTQKFKNAKVYFNLHVLCHDSLQIYKIEHLH